MMVKASNTAITYAAMLRPRRSEPQRRKKFSTEKENLRETAKTTEREKGGGRTHFGILQVEHSFSLYITLSYG